MKSFYEDKRYKDAFPVQCNLTKRLHFLAHWHPEVEMVYVLQGVALVGINQQARLLKKGDLAISTSGDIHYYEGISDQNNQIYVLIFHPQVIGQTEHWPVSSRFPSSFITFDSYKNDEEKLRAVAHMVGAMDVIIDELTKREKAYKYFVTAYINEISGLLLRHFSVEVPIGQSIEKIKKSLGHTRVYDILDHINKYYRDPITLADVSNQFSMSQSNLSKLFKKTVGMTFSTFINQKRARNAAYLLLKHELSVSEIAYSCGFDSIRTFNRVFRTLYDCSPTEYRFKATQL